LKNSQGSFWYALTISRYYSFQEVKSLGRDERIRRIKMSLPVLNEQQVKQILFVLAVAVTLFLLAFAYHAVVAGGFQLTPGFIVEFVPDGECNISACTAVGA
jgi:hypothetical protein